MDETYKITAIEKKGKVIVANDGRNIEIKELYWPIVNQWSVGDEFSISHGRSNIHITNKDKFNKFVIAEKIY